MKIPMKLLELWPMMLVSVSQWLILVSHIEWGGRPRANQNNQVAPRQIIAKFVRREVKSQILKNKKVLRTKPERANVYLDEDLTPLRARICKELRKEPGRRVWTMDGRIFTSITKEGKEVKHVLDKANDFLLLGWSEQKIQEVGLLLDI
ncbi:hypothetical protein HOLleu_26393 [Holothuria leucospilota]|uniref:Uncharacterized protein n=1 Tax=Holothuria leucospilota TaxID=206669 RepID=A0A9Q1H1J2_HOLLE|nr:hypothetical protein HOLleu_26393 [Holothuria leucospilota]